MNNRMIRIQAAWVACLAVACVASFTGGGLQWPQNATVTEGVVCTAITATTRPLTDDEWNEMVKQNPAVIVNDGDELDPDTWGRRGKGRAK